MSLRTRLIIAFLLLSVVPLSAVTFITYRSGSRPSKPRPSRRQPRAPPTSAAAWSVSPPTFGRRVDRLFVARGAAPAQTADARASGLPTALYPGRPYVEEAVPVGSGDLIFFYTDGLVETENAAGEMFGSERLHTWLAEWQPVDIGALLERLDAAVRQFRGGAEPMDDAPMMALRFGE